MLSLIASTRTGTACFLFSLKARAKLKFYHQQSVSNFFLKYGGPKPSQPLPLRGASCSSVPTVPTDLLFLLCRCSYCSYRPLLLLLLCSYCTVRTVPLFLLYCLYCSSLPTVRCYCSSVPAVSTPKKYKATYSIGSKTNVSKSTRKKEDKRKARKRSSLAVKNRTEE